MSVVTLCQPDYGCVGTWPSSGSDALQLHQPAPVSQASRAGEDDIENGLHRITRLLLRSDTFVHLFRLRFDTFNGWYGREIAWEEWVRDQCPRGLRASLKHQYSQTPTSAWAVLAWEAPLQFKTQVSVADLVTRREMHLIQALLFIIVLFGFCSASDTTKSNAHH